MPRAPKKCGRTGCELRVTGRIYCETHAAEAQERGNTTARGYGWQHQQARSQAIATLTPGTVCPRCGGAITLDEALDLDHTDDRVGYLGLSHRRCNQVAGARRPRGRDPLPGPRA